MRSFTASVGVVNSTPRSAAKRGSASRNWNMPDSRCWNSPKVSRFMNRLNICSSLGVSAIQEMYLSAVRGYSFQEVSEKRLVISSESLSFLSRSLSLGCEAAA